MAIMDQRRSATPSALRDGVSGPDPQGALLRPWLLPDGGRPPLVPDLADGLPARGDPAADDFTEYQILDQSIIVVRTEDGESGRCRTPAATAACGWSRAGGPARAGSCAPSTAGATPPTAPTPSSRRPGPSPSTTCEPGDLDLTPVRCEVWGGCAWINLDHDAPPLRECIEPFATTLDAWKMESLRAEWWYSFRLPVNWKLAEEAFLEQYHVVETHPQLVIPGRYPPRDPNRVRPADVRRVGAPLPAHDERRHGRHGPRQRRGRRRGTARHRAARPTRPWPWRSGSARSTTPSWRGTETGGATSPTSTSSRRPA